MDAARMLAGFRFAKQLAPETRRELDGALGTVSLKRPRTLIRRGESIAGVYLVLSGALRVYNIDARGRQATLYTVEAQDACIFAMNCAFRDLRYPAWVDNDEAPTELAIIPSATYRKLHAADPAVQNFTFDVLSSRVFDLMSTIEDLTALDLEQRLASYLTRKCDSHGLVQSSHAKLAAHLGTAREVVTRALRDLEARGLLTTARGQIHIHDPVALAARGGERA